MGSSTAIPDDGPVRDKTKSAETTASHADSPTQADSTRLDWASVIGGFLICSAGWGPALAYGTFQQYYNSALLSHLSASQISWIGTVDAFLIVSTGILTGPLFDRGHARAMIVLGAFLLVFGMMMLSIAGPYYQIFLSQGVCLGLGGGLVFVPTIALISQKFPRRKALALGIVTSGAAAGGVIFPIVFLHLRPTLGFAWTVRVLGFIQLASLLCGLLLALRCTPPRPTPPTNTHRPWHHLIDLSAFKDPIFAISALANFLSYLAYYIPIFYTPTFASTALHTSPSTGLYLLAGLNAGSVLSRALSPLLLSLTPRLRPATLLFLTTLVSAVLLYTWLRIVSLPGLAVFSALFGISSGILVSAGPVVNAHPVLSPEPDSAGARLGMQWFWASLGSLTGAPIAGALKQYDGGFVAGRVFGGCVMLGAAVCWGCVAVGVWRFERRVR